ncbi:MAG TPA: hypothetical protein VEZ17_04380, partial [Chitinophagaceae bacterium]|nr:hypothetical protein [Chitinophagaceae bacterium]
MTAGGLEESDRSDEDNARGRFRFKMDENGIEAEGNIDRDRDNNPDSRTEPAPSRRQRYRFENGRSRDSIRAQADSLTTISVREKPLKLALKSGRETVGSEQDSPIALYPLLMLFD